MAKESPRGRAKVSLEYMGFPPINDATWKLIFDAARARVQAVAGLEDTVLGPHEERLSRSIALDIILMRLQEKCMEADIYTDEFIIGFDLTHDALDNINDLLDILVKEIVANPSGESSKEYLKIIEIIKEAENPEQTIAKKRVDLDGVMASSKRPHSPMDGIVKAVLARDPDIFFEVLPLTSAQEAYAAALAFIQFEQPNLAERALRKAIQLDPNYSRPHIDLVKLLVTQDKHNEARQYVGRLIAGLSRDVAPYWHMLFDGILDGEDVPVSEDDHVEQERQLVILDELRTKIEQGNPQAIDEEVLTTLGNTPMACVEMSKVYQQVGRNDLTILVLKRALVLSPHHYYVIRILVPLLLSSGQVAEAKQLVDEYLTSIADQNQRATTRLTFEVIFNAHSTAATPGEKEVELPIELPAASASLAQLLMEASERNSKLNLDDAIDSSDLNVRLDLVLHRFRNMLVKDGLLNEIGFINPDFQLTPTDLDLLDTYLGQDLMDLDYSSPDEASPPLTNAVALIKKYCN